MREYFNRYKQVRPFFDNVMSQDVLSGHNEISFFMGKDPKLPNGVLERLKAYGRSVAHFPTAVKEVSDYRTPRHAHNKVHAYAPPPKPRRTLTPHLGLARSSSGGTDGSTRSQRRRSRRESPTRCPSTRRGSRSSALSREDQPQVVLNFAGCLFMRPCVHRRNAAGSLAREWRHCMWRHSNSGRPSA